MKLKNNKGFTGVDVAISVVVLTIFVSVIASLFYNTGSTSKKVERKSVATNLAIEVIEGMKVIGATDFNNLTPGMGIDEINALNSTNITVPNGYTVAIGIEDYRDENIVKILRVTVEYPDGKNTEQVHIETLVKNGEVAGGSGGNNPTMPSTWDSTKVIAVTSEDDVVVPVPIGYTASAVTGEKSVATGFVIKEGTNGGATEGINEFVWVPVSDITDLYDSTNNAGQLWDFSGTTSTKRTYPTTQNRDYREPDVVTSASSGSDSSSGSDYDAVSTYLQQAGLSSTATVADFKTQLQNEFTQMKNSVERYGGFYIGRYETGNLSQTTAVVQKNNSDIANQTWYTQYKLNKTIKANENVVSSMIWGCQWDATLRWMQTSSNSEVVNYVTDSTGKGHYSSGSNIATGSNSNYAVNNIYDMAGNVYEWTLGANSSVYRAVRGGSFDDDGGSYYSASFDDGYYPTDSNATLGSRVTLYVAL